MWALWADDTGQDIAEYAMMIGVLLVVTIAVIQSIGSNAQSLLIRLAQMLRSVA